ncbi:hypothetical protein QVD17_09126 [Tagetes erecta]|uniref:50S ribosomal protein 5, chloroplastic n=1 Tax=Tagetes erecta TaxID=13708 RepID=A0AAD8KZZ3_TARER|nr:hypothetical protein QVD17_09126 [Tagetes erecta]
MVLVGGNYGATVVSDDDEDDAGIDPHPILKKEARTIAMVVLHFTSIPQTLSPRQLPSSLTSCNLLCVVALVSGVLHRRSSVNLQSTHFNGVRVQGIKQRGGMIVKASAEIDGAGAESASDPPTETKDESSNNLSVEELPLESKLELKLQQKLKMKLAKKIRLRRKRLVRKRQLRKKGRWPPSKMKKNKNV